MRSKPRPMTSERRPPPTLTANTAASMRILSTSTGGKSSGCCLGKNPGWEEPRPKPGNFGTGLVVIFVPKVPI